MESVGGDVTRGTVLHGVEGIGEVGWGGGVGGVDERQWLQIGG